MTETRTAGRARRAIRAMRLLVGGLIVAGLLVTLDHPLAARPLVPSPRPAEPPLAETEALPSAAEAPGNVSRLFTTSAIETTYFGGTVWAADSNRYEAIPGGTWTFDSGVGSSLVPPGYACKPVGYHRTFEGWTEEGVSGSILGSYGVENPENPWRRTTTCALGGGTSMWLGTTEVEAQALCYAAGAGYGTDWDQYLGKTFQYPGSGAVTLSFDYAVDAEPDYDYLIVEVDRTGTATSPTAFAQVLYLTGRVSGHATLTLTSGGALPTQPGPVRIYFHGTSDGAYDDEDGFYPTTCGLATVDNVTLTGSLTDVATFESGTNGWAPVFFCANDEWADMATASTLPPPPACTENLGQCAVSDSVLFFHQPAFDGGHGDREDIVVSPWIDLRRAGITSMAGCFLQFDGYFKLRASSQAAIGFLVQWTGDSGGCGGSGNPARLVRTPLSYSAGYFPRCIPTGAPVRVDLSPYLPANARAVRVAVEVYAMGGPWDPDYDAAAWFDDVRFGVLDKSAPALVPHGPPARDAFATDGTLDPAASARVDAGGDTLTAVTAGENVEARVNFRLRPGPFTDPASLGAWAAARWSAAPGIGPGWWTARMDTAESRGVTSAGKWMSSLHESDPHFGGGVDTDRGGDGDAGLSHDIFPDHVLTPGARIDYFFSARYLPPDPRNPMGDVWSVLPDTTGGNYFEMEVLPSSMSADTTWNCVLFVNGHAADNDEKRRVEESALRQALGIGGLNAEGTRFDRADLGSPSRSRLNATAAQLGGYGAILWSLGETATYTTSVAIEDYDAARLSEWLAAATPARLRRFWYSGSWAVSGLVYGTTAQRMLAQNLLGVDAPQSDTDMPAICSALNPVAGSHFSVPGAATSRKPTCDRMHADRMLVPASAVTTAHGQLTLATGNLISISNDIPAAGRRTLVDAFPLYTLRDAGNSCDDPSAVTRRVVSALGWFGLPDGGACTPGGVSDVPPDPGPSAGGVLSLDPLFRRAGEEGWRVRFSLPVAGPATLRVHDVTGRLVATLAEELPLAAGRHELGWDGRGAGGQRVSAGLYFIRLATPSGSRTMKVVATTR